VHASYNVLLALFLLNSCKLILVEDCWRQGTYRGFYRLH